jgi:hypothetical protein
MHSHTRSRMALPPLADVAFCAHSVALCKLEQWRYVNTCSRRATQIL